MGTDIVKSIGKEEWKSFSIHGRLSNTRCDKNSRKITDQVHQVYTSPEMIKHWEHVIFWKPFSSNSLTDEIKCHQNVEPFPHYSSFFPSQSFPSKPIPTPTVLLLGNSFLGMTNKSANFTHSPHLYKSLACCFLPSQGPILYPKNSIWLAPQENRPKLDFRSSLFVFWTCLLLSFLHLLF